MPIRELAELVTGRSCNFRHGAMYGVHTGACPSDGIGRHAGFKTPCREASEFESRDGYSYANLLWHLAGCPSGYNPGCHRGNRVQAGEACFVLGVKFEGPSSPIWQRYTPQKRDSMGSNPMAAIAETSLGRLEWLISIFIVSSILTSAIPELDLIDPGQGILAGGEIRMLLDR